MLQKHNKRAAVCAGILLMLGACATASPATSEFCLIYEPVYVSEQDTEGTVNQVMRNNAAWEALCELQGDGENGAAGVN